MMIKWKKESIFAQLKANTVAIISLLTAIIGLSYNSWRDHQNEMNHNMRNAAFEVLKELGELQTVVNYAHYVKDRSRGNPVDGWGHVVLIRDVSRLLTPAASNQGQKLYVTWQHDWERLDDDAASETRISNEIALTRKAVLDTIDSLN
jgi:hypothetical protein